MFTLLEAGIIVPPDERLPEDELEEDDEDVEDGDEDVEDGDLYVEEDGVEFGT